MGSNEQKRQRVLQARYFLPGKSPVCWLKLLNWIFYSECLRIPKSRCILRKAIPYHAVFHGGLYDHTTRRTHQHFYARYGVPNSHWLFQMLS